MLLQAQLVSKESGANVGNESRPERPPTLFSFFPRSGALAVLLLFSIAVPAQQVRAPGNAPGSQLDEIIVTARKHEEGLHDSPISITVLSGQTLESRGLGRIDEIQSATPNLSFYGNSPIGASANSASVFLRGIGQSDFAPTTEPGVGLYIDGVYLGRSTGSVLDLVEIERVEVLRGPQGTLFGRNSIGGSISVITRKPHETFAVDARFTVGTDERLNAAATVNAPLADKLFAKFTAATFNQEGYVRNSVTGQDLGDDDTFAGRAAFRWMPDSSLTVDIAFDHSNDEEHGIPYVFGGAVFVDPTQPGGPNFAFINNVLAGSLTGCDGTFSNPAGSLTNPACLNDQYVGLNGGLGAFRSNIDVEGSSVGLEWNATDRLQLRSISAYRALDSDFAYDADATPIFIVDGIHDLMTQTQVTQELQLLGRALTDRLDWIVGLYYFQEDGENINPVDFLPVSLTSGGFYNNESVAAFGHAVLHIKDRLHLTAGVRYTEDTKRFLPDQVVTGGLVTLGIPGFPFIPAGTRTLPYSEVTIEDDDWTPTVNLAYDLSERLMIYVGYSEGFKGGGFHQRVFPPLPETPTFDPEFAKSREIGFKYQSDDRRFMLNGAAFVTDYRDLQVTVFTAIAPVLDNAGDAEISGLELEARWAPRERWLVEAGLGYLDTGYESVLPSTGLQGNERLPFVPERSASINLSRQFAVRETGTLTAQVEWSYRSSVHYDTFNTAFIDGSSYDVMNGSLSWLSSNLRYGLVARVDNVTDERYVRRSVYHEGFGTILDSFDRGRIWSLSGTLGF
jgi:iron complex outermembrane receptor protein